MGRDIPARCARIADSRAFNLGIFAVITANAVVLGLETYDGVRAEAGTLLSTLNDVFLAVFVVELAIRIAAHGSHPLGFFRSGWNVFDFVVIAGSFAPGLRENATLLRLARLARVIRVIRVLPDLRLLVTAMARSLPAVASLGVLTLVLLYVYGIVGWLIFDDHDPERYGSVGQAMLTLFVMLSLENLPENLELGLELSDWTVLYFVSYAVLAAFLIFNMLIGVVINSLEQAHELEWRREQDERRAQAAATEGEADDRRLALLEHIHDLRLALRECEREARAIADEGRASGRREGPPAAREPG